MQYVKKKNIWSEERKGQFGDIMEDTWGKDEKEISQNYFTISINNQNWHNKQAKSREKTNQDLYYWSTRRMTLRNPRHTTTSRIAMSIGVLMVRSLDIERHYVLCSSAEGGSLAEGVPHHCLILGWISNQRGQTRYKIRLHVNRYTFSIKCLAYYYP